MSNTIFYILGALIVIYLVIGIYNKRSGRQRRSRRFMEGYERKVRRNGKDDGKPDKKE